MARRRLVLVPETPVEPCGENSAVARVPVGVIAVACLLRKPIADAGHIIQRLQGIHKVFDEIILSGYRAFPDILRVGVDAAARPILEVIGAFHYLDRLVRKPVFEITDRGNQIAAVLFRGEIPVPERVVAQSDNIVIHLRLDKFGVIVQVIRIVGRTVCVDDNLRVRAELAYGVATGFEQSYITLPVVSGFFVRMYGNTAETVHDFVANLH